MVSSSDVPSDFILASFFVRPDLRVFQHNPPIPAIRWTAIEPRESTQSGPLECPRASDSRAGIGSEPSTRGPGGCVTARGFSPKLGID